MLCHAMARNKEQKGYGPSGPAKGVEEAPCDSDS